MQNKFRNYSKNDLSAFACRILSAAGVSMHDSAIVAEGLIDADSAGIGSHGLIQLLGYVEAIRTNEVQLGAAVNILRETSAAIHIDANYGLGHVQMSHIVERAIRNSDAAGVCVASVRNCSHIGRLGFWVEKIAHTGKHCGLIMVNDNGVLRCVAPPGTRVPITSTNPIAIGAPIDGTPFCIDISTSMVANGKIRQHYHAGELCPEGWLESSDGVPTRDPSVRFSTPPGYLLPLGAPEFAYKGFGLALAIDLFAGALAGGFCPPAPAGSIELNNVLLVVLAVDVFAGSAQFVAQAVALRDFLHINGLRMPGEGVADRRIRSLASGIELRSETVDRLNALAKRLGVGEIPL